MRTKPGVDILSFDDLYNNLRVFEYDIKAQLASSSSTQNVIQGDSKGREIDAWNTGNKEKDNGRRSGKQEDSKALVTIDGEGVDWTSHSERRSERTMLSWLATVQAQTQREQLGDASIEIQAYTQALKKVEAQLVAHQQGQLCQMSARDKAGLGEETHESMPKPVVNEPNVVSQPKVWFDAPIIEEYESDSEDEHVSLPTKEQEIPSFAAKHVKTPSHLIRDCDFHEKMMAKQAELINRISKGSSQREIRPVWDNVQRMNHQNQFVPKAVLTRTEKIPVNTARTSGTNTVNTARHNFNRQAVPINAVRKVNTVKPIVNNSRPKACFHNSVLPFRKSFYRTTALRTNFSKQKVNTAEVNAVSIVKGKRETAVKSSAVHMTWKQGLPCRITRLNVALVAFGGKLQHFNLFSVSQICDKKNKVLFTDSECLVLSFEFKLPDENQVLLRIPRQNNMYSFNLENIVPSGGLACLIAKATIDESNKWHRRKATTRPPVKHDSDHYVIPYSFCHMDLHGPYNLKELKRKTSCLVISDDFSMFSTEDNIDAGDSKIEAESAQDHFVLPIWSSYTSTVKSSKANNAVLLPHIKKNSIHPSTLVLGDPKSAVQTRNKVTKSSGAHAFKISEALEDECWVDAMQKELLQFKIQKVWILVDLPYGKKEIGTKWVYRNKKDERGVVVRNKARPDIMFAVCACSRFQVNPKTSHLSVVKRIFRYLKSKPKLGIWYLIVSLFDLEAYLDSDYARANLDRKSTTGEWLFLNMAPKHNMDRLLKRLMGIQSFMRISAFLCELIHMLSLKSCISTTIVEQFWMSAKSKLINNVRYIIAKVAGKPVSISEASIRSDLLFNDVDG
ncbi:hypothetical protein Tco_1019014 [Tanacetum coccineum]|uniref:Reverse transcriptase Ty1/copia-type domain-containing protein n=1 Tax=Tanacetum coccineum TaxID=301880 RepID=A0ABQ5FX36_9ASTR